MPGGFIYAGGSDPYGSSEGTAQGRDNSERNYVLGLMAAQNAAARIMQEQQRINLGAQAAQASQKDARDYRQAQINLGYENAQTQIDRANQEQDYRLKALAAGEEDRNLKVEDLLNQRDTLGSTWAKELNQAIEENSRVFDELSGSTSERDAAAAKVREFERMGSIRPDAKVRGKYQAAAPGPKTSEDPDFAGYITKLNAQRAEFANTELPKLAQKAAETAKEHAARLKVTQQLIDQIHRGGFGVDPQAGSMIDTQTRKLYPFVATKVPKATASLVPAGEGRWKYSAP